MRTLLLLLFCLLVLLPPTAQSAPLNSQEAFRQGRRSFEAGKFDQAYDLFYQAFRQEPADLEISFYLGRAAFEKGDYEAALMAYDRILLMQPDTPRAKLELARTHLELGAREEAKRYFNEVLAASPPAQVRRNIENFLAAIELAEQKNFWSGLLSVGVSHDDNVRVAPINEEIRTLFGNYLLETPESDYLFTTTTVLNHQYKFTDTPFAWKTGVLNYNAFYDTEDDLEINFLGVTTGLLKQKSRWQWEIFGSFNHLELDYDRYLGTWGLGSSYTYIANEQTLLISAATLQQKENYQDRGKDGLNLRLTAGPVFILGPSRLTVSASLEEENARDEANTYRRFALLARYDRQLPHDFSVFAGFRFENSEYGEDPGFKQLYGVNRSDKLRDLSVGLAKILWWSKDQKRNLAAQINYTNTRVDSSIGIYEYEKNVVTTSLSLVF